MWVLAEHFVESDVLVTVPLTEVKTRARLSELLLKHTINTVEAKSNLERCVLLLRTLKGRWDLKIYVYDLLSLTYILLGHGSQAAEAAETALAIAADQSKPTWRPRLSLMLAHALHIKGDTSRAVNVCEQLCKTPSDTKIILTARLVQALMLLQTGQFKDAMSILVPCGTLLDQLPELNSLHAVHSLLMVVGNILQGRGVDQQTLANSSKSFLTGYQSTQPTNPTIGPDEVSWFPPHLTHLLGCFASAITQVPTGAIKSWRVTAYNGYAHFKEVVDSELEGLTVTSQRLAMRIQTTLCLLRAHSYMLQLRFPESTTLYYHVCSDLLHAEVVGDALRPWIKATTHLSLAHFCSRAGYPDNAVQHAARAMTLAEDLNDGLLQSEAMLAHLLFRTPILDAADTSRELTAVRQLKSRKAVSSSQHLSMMCRFVEGVLGLHMAALVRDGQADTASESVVSIERDVIVSLREVVLMTEQCNSHQLMAQTLLVLAEVYVTRGTQEAVEMFGLGVRLSRTIGDILLQIKHLQGLQTCVSCGLEVGESRLKHLATLKSLEERVEAQFLDKSRCENLEQLLTWDIS
eukprot:c14052_g1_i2.p1 GENE.c14052_g1_i2~~c14052_g1_i2.p1  ORF type:complete len:597 (+),score=119.58 c14052_g1_i2:64-1791(+)